MPTHQTGASEPLNPDENTAEPQGLEVAIAPLGQSIEQTGFTITDEGVDLHEEMTFDQYRNGLGLFKWAQTKLKIGFSDYVRKGKIKFGDSEVSTALEQMEFDLGVVKEAIDIATIPEEIRHDNLTPEHYVVLARAGITAAQRKKWAKTASDQSLKPIELKASITMGEVVHGKTGSGKPTQGIMSVHGIRADFDIWLTKVGGAEAVLKLDAAVRKEIMGELEAPAKLYLAIGHSLDKSSKEKPAKPKKAANKKAAK